MSDKTKSKDEPESSKKDSLIVALAPLQDDFPWLKDEITNLIKSLPPSLESSFEISGIARGIVYDLISEKPTLFESQDVKTEPLRIFLVECFSHIMVRHMKKDMVKLAQEISKQETKSLKAKKR
jgi:hypothetical protein